MIAAGAIRQSPRVYAALDATVAAEVLTLQHEDPVAALLLLPYLAWSGFATTLNVVVSDPAAVDLALRAARERGGLHRRKGSDRMVPTPPGRLSARWSSRELCQGIDTIRGKAAGMEGAVTYLGDLLRVAAAG